MSMNYYRVDGWVKLVSGQAVPGAQVYFLQQPANLTQVTPPRTIPVPFVPNPQINIFSDAGFTPLLQPVLTDGFGHYDAYMLPQVYTLAIYFGGKLQNFYIDQSIGNAGSSPASPLVLSTNGTPNFSQTALNFIQGAGITLATDNLGNMTITGSSITYPGDPTKFLNGTGVFSTPPTPAGLTLQTNGTPNGSQTLQNLVNGTGISITQNGAGNVTVTNTLPATLMIGPFGYRCMTPVSGTPAIVALNGVDAESEAVINASTLTAASTSLPSYRTQTTGAGGSTNTSVWSQGPPSQATILGDVCLIYVKRWLSSVRLNQTTNCRVWQGMSNCGSATSQTTWSTNTPNWQYVMFRFCSTTDTTWKFVTGTDNTHQTVVDTGVVPSGSFQLLQFDFDGSTLTALIDGVACGFTSLTLPTAIIRLFGSIDNKNTNNNVTVDWSDMLYFVKA